MSSIEFASRASCLSPEHACMRAALGYLSVYTVLALVTYNIFSPWTNLVALGALALGLFMVSDSMRLEAMEAVHRPASGFWGFR